MWPFTGGSHYVMDFVDYEKSYIAKKIQNYKKKIYTKKLSLLQLTLAQIRSTKKHNFKKL